MDYDKVKNIKLHQLLVSNYIDSNDIGIISIGTKKLIQPTEGIEVRRGVRQGFIVSPLPIYLYSEAIFREILEDE